ncbi:MAG: septal ring lytic transglycosylase RlpA family protein [Defluviicoccus sp.]
MAIGAVVGMVIPGVLIGSSYFGGNSNKPGTVYSREGTASWYGAAFSGKKTASGERFDPNDLTAAHRTLPLGTEVKVTNVENGKSVEVEVNDRGPYAGGRLIDLSRAAAQKLDMIHDGTAPVRVEATADQLPPDDEAKQIRRREAGEAEENKAAGK